MVGAEGIDPYSRGKNRRNSRTLQSEAAASVAKERRRRRRRKADISAPMGALSVGDACGNPSTSARQSVLLCAAAAAAVFVKNRVVVVVEE